MTELLFSLALVVLTVALIAISMTVKHLSEKIDELKDGFEFHKKYTSTKGWHSNLKSKSFVSDSTNLKGVGNEQDH